MLQLIRIVLGFLVLVGVSFMPRAVLAADGVIEISAACVATGCFPGDGPGYPVTIVSRGSYRLTSNLERNSLFNGTVDGNSIAIQSSEVTLDLGGFSIRCSASAPSSDTCPGNAVGIFVGNVQAVTIRNGTIRGMPSFGVLCSATDSAIEDLLVTQNGRGGIVSQGARSIVRRTVTTLNFGPGITMGPDSLVESCVSSGNTGMGIDANHNPIKVGYRGCVIDSVEVGVANLGGNAIFP